MTVTFTQIWCLIPQFPLFPAASVLRSSWLFLSSSSSSLLLPGRGHHSDAGEKDASLPVASLWHLWVQVRAGRPLVPTVSDNIDG